VKHFEIFDSFPHNDADWTEDDWKRLIDWLIHTGLVTAHHLAALVLGHLNPSQVGTSIASKKSFQKHFPPRQIMRVVIKWHLDQSGTCEDCGSRLELQADHVIPREQLGDEADKLENMTLRCRRCNVIRRPSHKHGGKTFLTAESALMWILFTKHPSTYQEYEKLCRSYGMTMANIRFQEAWAMAHWLQKIGLYEISPESKL
jgi:5-methylcytosine-specific restriction endonuclease McrA